MFDLSIGHNIILTNFQKLIQKVRYIRIRINFYHSYQYNIYHPPLNLQYQSHHAVYKPDPRVKKEWEKMTKTLKKKKKT